MKELSIEEKAKAYDEAIKIANEYFDSPRTCIDIDVLPKLFPELKESEDGDEKVRKALIKLVTNHASMDLFIEYDIHLDEALSWLEKQGENTYNKELSELLHKVICRFINDLDIPYSDRKKVSMEIVPYVERIEKQGEQKPADKVEPKFKDGDWVTSDGESVFHVKIDNNKYQLETLGGTSCHFSYEIIERKFRLWTIQDAKVGDVLVNQNGEMPFIFKECKNNHIYCYCGYTNHKDIFFDRFVNSEGEELHWSNLYYEQVCPATKEQRAQLERAMTNAGYEWNAEKKELRKIEQKTSE